MRIKHRYLITQILDDGESQEGEQIASKDVINSIRDQVTTIFGDFGMGKFGIGSAIKYYDNNTSRKIFVLRVGAEHVNDMWFAMSCVTQVKAARVSLRCLAVASCNRTCLTKTLEIMSRVLGVDVNDTCNEEFGALKARLSECFS